VDPVRVVPPVHGGVDSVTQLEDDHLKWKVTVGGVSREFDTRITEQHPDERVAWRSTDGTSHAGVITFHRLADGKSRVTAQIDWTPDGLAEKAGALVRVGNGALARGRRPGRRAPLIPQAPIAAGPGFGGAGKRGDGRVHRVRHPIQPSPVPPGRAWAVSECSRNPYPAPTPQRMTRIPLAASFLFSASGGMAVAVSLDDTYFGERHCTRWPGAWRAHGSR
jgi:hypothetical protein